MSEYRWLITSNRVRYLDTFFIRQREHKVSDILFLVHMYYWRVLLSRRNTQQLKRLQIQMCSFHYVKSIHSTVCANDLKKCSSLMWKVELVTCANYRVQSIQVSFDWMWDWNVFKVALQNVLNSSNLIGALCYRNAISSLAVVCWDVLWIE